jgi:DNA-binding GntR family transcriptional regulator
VLESSRKAPSSRRDAARTRTSGADPAQTSRRIRATPPDDNPFEEDDPNQARGKGSRGASAYQRLRDAIATGRLKPGARVLESELAALLNMSRTPIREAIASLEAEGLVSMDGARGRVVTNLDYQSVMELYAVREVLESTAAALAARNASDMEIAALREMLEHEEQILDDPGKLADHNRRFHEAIYYCSHNRYIVKMLQYLQTAMLLLQPAGRTGPGRRDTALAEHRAVVDAIEARDPAKSEAAIRTHVRRAQQARIKMLLTTGRG